MTRIELLLDATVQVRELVPALVRECRFHDSNAEESSYHLWSYAAVAAAVAVAVAVACLTVQ